MPIHTPISSELGNHSITHLLPSETICPRCSSHTIIEAIKAKANHIIVHYKCNDGHIFYALIQFDDNVNLMRDLQFQNSD